jgi:voltage-gated potassium channel
MTTQKLWRNNIILFLALFLIIFIAPILPANNNILVNILLGVVIIFGAFAADFETRFFRILLGIAVMVASLFFLGTILKDFWHLRTISFFLAVITLILYTISLIYHIAQAKKVDKATLFVAINSYLLIGMTGSILLIIIDVFQPGSVIDLQIQDNDLHTYFYFGFVTLTTLGYGDISPDGALARSVSTFIALTGQLYLVIIMALIIGKFLKD